MAKIIRNRIKCLKCGNIIESKHRHDFVWCPCGSCAVDGGTWYLKRSWMSNGEKPEDVYEEMSEVVAFELKGEWKIDEYGIYHCPICHAINNTVYKNFCPNCGADLGEIRCKR